MPRLQVTARHAPPMSYGLQANAAELIADPSQLQAYRHALSRSQMRALLETLTGAGMEHITNAGRERILLWNNHQDPNAIYYLAQDQRIVFNPKHRFQLSANTLPRLKVFHPEIDFVMGKTSLVMKYGDLLEIPFSHDPGQTHSVPCQYRPLSDHASYGLIRGERQTVY